MQLTIIITFRIDITKAHSLLSIDDYISFPLTDFISILSQCFRRQFQYILLHWSSLFYQQFSFIMHITLFFLFICISFAVKNFDVENLVLNSCFYVYMMVASDCVYFHMAHGFIVPELQKKNKYFLKFKQGFSLLQRCRKHKSYGVFAFLE